MKIRLSKPLEVEPASGATPAKTVEELVLNFDQLTGLDVLSAERMAIIESAMPVLNMRTSGAFMLQMAARASGIDSVKLSQLPALDFIAMIERVQGFLSSGD